MSLHRRLVPVQYRECEYCLFRMRKETRLYPIAIFQHLEPSGFLCTFETVSLWRYDYLSITNEKGKSFGKYCGGPYRKDATLETIGKYVLLNFHSDGDFQKKGYRLSFSTFSLPGKYMKFSLGYILFETLNFVGTNHRGVWFRFSIIKAL